MGGRIAAISRSSTLGRRPKLDICSGKPSTGFKPARAAGRLQNLPVPPLSWAGCAGELDPDATRLGGKVRRTSTRQRERDRGLY
jgi:hypothetical protein